MPLASVIRRVRGTAPGSPTKSHRTNAGPRGPPCSAVSHQRDIPAQSLSRSQMSPAEAGISADLCSSSRENFVISPFAQSNAVACHPKPLRGVGWRMGRPPTRYPRRSAPVHKSASFLRTTHGRFLPRSTANSWRASRPPTCVPRRCFSIRCLVVPHKVGRCVEREGERCRAYIFLHQ